MEVWPDSTGKWCITVQNGQTAQAKWCMTNDETAQAKWCLEDFIELSVLGAGAMAVVKKVMHRDTGDVYALKKISRRKITENNMETHIRREITTHLQLRHPNIIRMYGFFEDPEDIRLLMEHAPLGDLYGHLHSQPSCRLAEAEAIQIFVQIVSALLYLHRLGVAHRDLKPENVLLCAASVVKLADFGWCAESLTAGSKRQTFCGTQEYLSPELLSGEDHDHRVDLWAAGVLLYEMLVGEAPFAESSLREAFRRICTVDIHLPSHISPDARDLIQRLLKRHPEDRLALEEALMHKVVQSSSRGYEIPDDSLHIEAEHDAHRLEERYPHVPNLKLHDMAEYHSANDRDSTTAASLETRSSESACSPCSKVNEDDHASDQSSSLFTDANLNADSAEDLQTNWEEQRRSGINFGTLLEAPGWASSKMSESMRKVASSMADTISEITSDFDSWNHQFSDEANPDCQLRQAHDDSTGMSWSWLSPVDGRDAQEDVDDPANQGRTSQFLLGSSLVPTNPHEWEPLGRNNPLFSSSSSEPSENLGPDRTLGSCPAMWSPGKPTLYEQQANQYRFEQSLRFPSKFSELRSEVRFEMKGLRLLPDPDELFDRLGLLEQD